MNNIKLFLLILGCLIILFYVYIKYNKFIKYNNNKSEDTNIQLLNQRFYDYKKVYPELEILKDNRNKIIEEVENINKLSWDDWPEKDLYKDDMSWKVFPFYGFNIWITHNCDMCPEITKIIKKIPNLRTASLSKFKSKTKLKPHKGYANLSNDILRCHYGIKVPDLCYIYVENDKQQMKNNEIIVFDDSKTHYAENLGDDDRIVLILDIERPDFIEKGKSDYIDNGELNSFINSFKMMNQNKIDI